MILDYFVFLIFCWAAGTQLDAILVYSKRSTWTEAMRFCLEHGGRPAAQSDIPFSLDTNTNGAHDIWTSDYAVQADMQNINDSVLGDELYPKCGYALIHVDEYKNIGLSRLTQMNKYITDLTSTGQQYFDGCKSGRPFICSGKLFPVVFLTKQTWSDAFKTCLDHNMTLGENVPFEGQFATIFRSDEPLRQSYEVWTSEERVRQLLTFTGYSYEEQIEKVGVYGQNERFRLIDLKNETNLSSICLLEDHSNGKSLYPTYENGYLGWVKIFGPPSCIVLVAILSSLGACHLVRRKRKAEISPPLSSFKVRKPVHEATEVVYANNGVKTVDKPNSEIDETTRRFESNPASIYNTPCSITNEISLVESKKGILYTSEENVYDNKEFKNPKAQQGMNLYARANFCDGEPMYD